MKILGIETSAQVGSLALVEDEHFVAQGDIDSSLNHSAGLIPVLEGILRDAGWKIKDLEGIGVGLGPGSFTGIRVGLAAGQGIAFGTGIPLIGIGSLHAAARGSSAPNGSIVVLLPAARERVYGAVYKKDGDEIEELIGPRIVSADDFEGFCRRSWVVSPAWKRLKPKAEEWGITGGEEAEIHARWVAVSAQEKYRKNPNDEIETAAPIYLSEYWKSK